MRATVHSISEASEARQFMKQYFAAWSGTDVEAILAWYADDVTLRLPSGTLEGKQKVREGFVSPFVAAFPGNVHEIQRLLYDDGVVAVEWRFKAVHSGDLRGIPASGRKTDVPGCSFYALEHGLVISGDIYFDFATLLDQISQGASQ